MNDKLIDLKNITKIYNENKRNAKVALDNINLTFPSTGLFFIVGKSGCGKTTLLNIIGGTDYETKGELYFGNNLINVNNLCDYRALYIGHIYQNFNLLDNLTVKDNLVLAYNIINKSYDEQETKNILTKLKINQYLNTKVKDLSGGEQQRVSIARALIKNAKVILADEPTGQLDTNTAKEIFNILNELAKDRLVIIVSHDIENAKTYADKIITIVDGKINDTIDTTDTITFPLEHNKGLTFKNITKLAFSNFSIKISRLITLIILSSVILSFVAFSLSSLSFNPGRVFAEEFVKYNDYLQIDCNNGDIVSELEDKYKTPFTRQVTRDYLILTNNPTDNLDYINVLSDKYSYNLDIVGNMPRDNEILITKEMYEAFKSSGFTINNETLPINDYEDLIGLPLKIHLAFFIGIDKNVDLTISGIITSYSPEIIYPCISLDTYNTITTNRGIVIDSASCSMLPVNSISEIYYNLLAKDPEYVIVSEINFNIRSQIEPVLGVFSNIFLPIGLVFVLFMIYLTYAYLNLCLNLRKKEIGILKLLGSNNKTIFKIYYLTSLFLSLITSIVSSIVVLIALYYINDFFKDYFGVTSDILTYTYYEFLAIFGLSLLSTFLGVFIPIYKNAKLSPISYLHKEEN